ncbi:MAG: hypothetical protein WDN10_01825 [bacterium]
MEAEAQKEVSEKKKFIDLKPNKLSMVLLAVSVVVIFVYDHSDVIGLLGFLLGWLVAVIFLERLARFIFSKVSRGTALNIALVVYLIIFFLVRGGF